ncbi:MAG: signal peptide peptidase SppA [Desulfovibrionaceae bacterium]
MQQNKLSFSQRHPFVFGFAFIAAAAVLLVGAMAAARFFFFGGKGFHFSSQVIGVVHVDGEINDARKVGDWIDSLENDNRVKGVLIRVNSPGGGVGPSQELHRAVKRLAGKKPVVVSMGSVAASGGYYLSSPAHRIFASAGTITGSIGVKMELTNFQGLMDKIGVGHQTLASGGLKDAASPFRPLSDEERRYLDSLVMDMFDQFVGDVAGDRGLDVAQVKAIADGRAMTGRQAKEAGLVDQLGDLRDALADLKDRCGMTGDVSLLEGPPEETNWLRDILSSALSLRPLERAGGARWQFYYQ